MPAQQQPPSLFHKIFDLAQCILGIYVFFVIMSIYQEKMYGISNYFANLQVLAIPTMAPILTIPFS